MGREIAHIDRRPLSNTPYGGATAETAPAPQPEEDRAYDPETLLCQFKSQAKILEILERKTAIGGEGEALKAALQEAQGLLTALLAEGGGLE
ncbi:MAG: hypothetical protein HYV02_04845 [Deltaproteobacteria bacterium]|nr:hypothetical protein [Deltaproteobacteria bacterium]